MRTRPLHPIGAAAVLGLALASASGARADLGHAPDPARAFGRGAQILSLSGGYGLGFGAFGSSGTENADVELGALLPAWGIGLSDPMGTGPLRGSFAFHVEGQLLWNGEPRSGFAGGGGILLRYNLLWHERVVPFLELGGGLMGVDFDLRQQRDGFNFLIQSGVGAHWLLTPRTALTGGWRYHHISNARTRLPNAGINSHLFHLGISIFARP